MNSIYKIVLVITIFICLFLACEQVNSADVNITDCVDHNVTVKVSDTGSKQFWSIDNLVGAKNKIYTNYEKDIYEIDGYSFDNGDFVQLIYNNGKQNNADKKQCYVNGELSDMVKIYGKDGDQTIRVNYTVFKHDNITVNFINEIGGRYTSISNNIGKDSTWSNNGKIFNNQISGLEFIETEEGNYTFVGWMDDLGDFVNSFRFNWMGNQLLNFNYTAVYDFTPIPVNNSTDNNSTDENQTVIDNRSNDTLSNNETFVLLQQNETSKYQNNETSLKNNKPSLLNDKKEEDKYILNTVKKPVFSHITGHNFWGTILLLLFFAGIVYISRKG